MDIGWDTFDKGSVALSYVVVASTVFSAWQLNKNRKVRKLYLEAARSATKAEHSAILAVGVGETDIRPDVERWRASADLKVPDERCLHIRWDRRLTADEAPDFERRMREAGRELQLMGVDTIHLFYGGPVVGAAVIGAVLSNRTKVFVYQNVQGSYVNMGLLEYPV